MINIPVILVMLGAAALLWGFGIEPKLLKTSVYRIRQPELAGLKIVFASDFHAAPGHERRLRKIVGRIAAQQADMILLGGDFVKGRRFEKSMPIEKIAPILAELHAPLGVYAVLGNHDWRRDGVRIADVLQNTALKFWKTRIGGLTVRAAVFGWPGWPIATCGGRMWTKRWKMPAIRFW